MMQRAVCTLTAPLLFFSLCHAPGKTTLATALVRDVDMLAGFDVAAWVTVGEPTRGSQPSHLLFTPFTPPPVHR
jgi:hypothetical protein